MALTLDQPLPVMWDIVVKLVKNPLSAPSGRSTTKKMFVFSSRLMRTKEKMPLLFQDQNVQVYRNSLTGSTHMTYYFLNVPSQKFPVTKITIQSKIHSLNLIFLSSLIESSGEEV